METATNAIVKMKNLPGFVKYPEGFSISRYVIDERNWVEGFGADNID